MPLIGKVLVQENTLGGNAVTAAKISANAVAMTLAPRSWPS